MCLSFYFLIFIFFLYFLFGLRNDAIFFSLRHGRNWLGSVLSHFSMCSYAVGLFPFKFILFFYLLSPHYESRLVMQFPFTYYKYHTNGQKPNKTGTHTQSERVSGRAGEKRVSNKEKGSNNLVKWNAMWKNFPCHSIFFSQSFN